MAERAEWWRNGAKEIHRGESDGQRFTSVFVRDVRGEKEYAVVECSDGDYVDHIFGGVLIRGDKATPIETD